MRQTIATLVVCAFYMTALSAPIRSIIAARSAMNEGTDQGGGEIYGGLCIIALEPNVVVNMTKTGSPPTVALETSRDGVNWIPFDADSGTTPITLPTIGSRVYFRAGDSGNARLASGHDSEYRSFTLSGLCSAHGDVTSLLSREFPVMSFSQSYTMVRLFSNCKYLTTAPILPTTSLREYCYHYMFYGCSSLTIAPTLPAQTMMGSCYHGMFYGCTSLKTAPELPNSLAVNCFREMFRKCTSLTSAPKIRRPATSRACYASMFTGCSSLNDIVVEFSSFKESNQGLWLANVAATGTFHCPTALGTQDTITRGVSACPEGWTVVNTD